uniref:RNase H type-1 domain-containing protein n=1 Tax=Globisporangium ultimum (strain ATCC 200006 / CBS 805.95 / DAOM BR144) TaxID=431595 RepID=K3WLV1_GLOUD
MSYSHSTTTNNMAEYCGLLHGLRYAHDHQYLPLHVVEDSSMIIWQQTLHVPSKKTRLALLYHKTKCYANAMRISSWAHHFGAYNKMADMAANHAMDRVMPSQYPLPTTRAEGDKIQQYMENDVGHWFNMEHGQQRASCLDKHAATDNMRNFLISRFGETPAAPNNLRDEVATVT